MACLTSRTFLIAICVLVLAGTGQSLIFLETPEIEIFIHPGDNYTLTCLTNYPLIGNISDDPVTIRWQRDGELIVPGNGTGFDDLGNGTLEIVNMQPYDGWKEEPAQFRCLATNSQGTLVSRIAHVGLVYLDEYPETARPRKVYGILGNTAVLSCPGDGIYPARPLPIHIQWIRDGKPVENPRAIFLPSGDMQILGYREEDAGEYHCIMINPAQVQRENETLELIRQEREWLDMREEWLINEKRRIPDFTLTFEQRRTFEHYFWLVEERRRVLQYEDELRNVVDTHDTEFRTSPAVTLVTETFLPIQLTFDKAPPSRAQNPLTIFLGWPVVLEVAASGVEVPQITWAGPGNREDLGISPDRAKIIGTGNLEINPTFENDTGFYRVTARSGTETISQVTHLVVQVPPTAATFPDNQTVFEGETMTIECNANGTTHYKKSWFHNGEDMLLEQNETLVFHFVNLTHNGIYQCFVENEAGVGMAAAYVTILSLPTFIRHPTPHVVILDTQNFEISCAVAGEPFPWVTWLFNGEELEIINGTVNDTFSTANKTVWWNVTEIDGHPVLMTTLHSNASTYGETGAYTCRANNTHGVVESQAAIVDVYGRPEFDWLFPDQFAPLNDHYTFEFETAGLPMPEVEYEYPEGADLEGRAQVLAGGHLRILFVRRSDFGTYKVTLTNKFGSETAEIHLGVQVEPEVFEIQTTPKPILGQDFWMSCDMTGAPLPNVTWFKNGVPILRVWDPLAFNVPIWVKYDATQILIHPDDGPDQIVRGNLTLRYLTQDDFAMYTCQGETPAGTGEQIFRLGPNGPIILDEELNEDIFPIWLMIVTIVISAVLGYILFISILYGIFRFLNKDSGNERTDSRQPKIPIRQSKPPKPKLAPKPKESRISQPAFLTSTTSASSARAGLRHTESSMGPSDRPASGTFLPPVAPSKPAVYSMPEKDADSTTV